MMKINGAFPVYPYDPCHPVCCTPDKKGMNFVGERTTEWLMNKVDAKDQEVYYNTDTNEYWMSIGYNKWEKWQGVGSSPVPPTPGKEQLIYIGALNEQPTSADAIHELEERKVFTDDMKAGWPTTIFADEQYVVIAFDSSIGTITSLTEGGIEALSDFEIIKWDNYTFYCTSEKVYDPDEEISYVIKWSFS